MSSDEIWLSVVTVVKDDPQGFERTLTSISEQKLDGVEYIVIDGSSDRDEIQNLLKAFPQLQARYRWAQPQGIYAAMNLSLEFASGHYVYFANAGDEFADKSVVDRARECLANETSTWAFGPVEIIEVDGKSVVTPDWDYAKEKLSGFSGGHFPSHQGTFVRTQSLKDLGGFDSSYSIVADYAAFLQFSLESDPVVLPFVVARFYEGGTSTQRWQESFRQFHRARLQILKLTGMASMREHLNTYRLYLMVFLTREVKPRLRF